MLGSAGETAGGREWMKVLTEASSGSVFSLGFTWFNAVDRKERMIFGFRVSILSITVVLYKEMENIDKKQLHGINK